MPLYNQGVNSVSKSGSTKLNGDVTLSQGSNITLTQTGQDISIASTGGGASPLTTKGDIYTYSTVDTRLPVGTDGQVLSANSAQPTGLEWITAGGTGTVTSVGITGSNGIGVSGSPITTSGSITLSLGAITPTSVNSIVFSGASTPTLSVTGTSSISGSNTGDQTITLTGDVTGSGTGSFATSISAGVIVDADVNATAGIGLTKLAATTASRALVSDASGFITPATTTSTEIGYVNGVTSSIQTQLNGKQATGNYITALTGDVTASGPGSAAATLATVTVAKGGTGRTTSTTAYGLIAAGTTATGALQTLAAGATTTILVGGGASALPVWTTASGTGAPLRQGSPTITTPTLGSAGYIADVNGNELVKFPATVASAVNEVTISNSITLSPPSIAATGTDTNISLDLQSKGAGSVLANGTIIATANNTLTLSNKDITSSTNTFPTTSIGYAQSTTIFSTASTSAVQVTGLSVTVTVPSTAATRRVVINVSTRSTYNTNSGGYNTMSLWSGTVGSGTLLMESVNQSQIAVGESSLNLIFSHVPGAGTFTYNVGFKVNTGTGFITVGSPAVPMAILAQIS